MDFMPWLIPVIAIVGGIRYAILKSSLEERRIAGEARRHAVWPARIAENAAVNKALLEKLDSIDARLGAVEKTLTDIP